MKKITILVASTVATMALASSAFAANATPPAASSPSVDMNKVSYIIGYEIGNGFKTQGIEVNQDQLTKGLQTGLSGKDSTISKQDIKATMQAFQKEMMAKAIKKQQEASTINAKTSSEYFAKVAKEDGVKKLSDGIMYKVETEGKGKKPLATDTVEVNYEGTLANGKVFDSSYKRGQAATFPLNQVIPCWTKALQQMPVGSTWTVYCPSEQAYGKNAPPQIGANQALTFKINLIKIDSAKTAKVATDSASAESAAKTVKN